MDDKINWEKLWNTEKNNEYWKIPDSDFITFIEELPQRELDVLDYGCGIGRHSIYLAKQGYEVTAIDISNNAIQYLLEWSNKEKVNISTYIGDLYLKELSNKKYDLIVSINVLYHGRRNTIKIIICEIHERLKKNGLFYLTFLTRNDDKYGVGIEIEPHTYHCDTSIHEGDIHYFADESDLKDLFKSFEILSIKKVEYKWTYKGKNRFSSFWKMCCKPYNPVN